MPSLRDSVYMNRVCDYGVFFFFKQKTAYEMRISDWSSDVCSSDLHLASYGFRLSNIVDNNVDGAADTTARDRPDVEIVDVLHAGDVDDRGAHVTQRHAARHTL